MGVMISGEYFGTEQASFYLGFRDNTIKFSSQTEKAPSLKILKLYNSNHSCRRAISQLLKGHLNSNQNLFMASLFILVFMPTSSLRLNSSYSAPLFIPEVFIESDSISQLLFC